jgi:DNA modification methylase/superfamily II DNA or RNA helicase
MTSAVSLDYETFLSQKTLTTPDVGRIIPFDLLHPRLFPFQKDIVKWAVKRGRAAIWAAVGLGKTLMYGEWMRQVNEVTIIMIPLGIARQTVRKLREHLKIEARYVRSQNEIKPDECKFYITNYDIIEKFDPSTFKAVILDESSILKNYSGVIKRYILREYKHTPYKLALTATPAPNDLLELGNHAEFLNVMTSKQMISVFFIQEDRRKGDKFRLKRHAVKQFYQWLASWAVAMRRPSDLGYSDEGYQLPAIKVHLHTVDSNYTPPGMMPGFGVGSISATAAKKIRRETIAPRAEVVAKLLNASDEQWIVWCDLNQEAEDLHELVDGSINVHGSLSIDAKNSGIESFIDGETRVLITKPKIAGMGVDMQHCKNMLFMGMGFSWETYHQAVGRIARFGQLADEVQVHLVISEQERSVYEAVERKGREAEAMIDQLIEAMQDTMQANLQPQQTARPYVTGEAEEGRWKLLLGDCVRCMAELPDNSVDEVLFSPPFSDLFVFSNMVEDLSNCLTHEEFMAHMAFVAKELLRITKPGRICAFHIQDRKLTYVRDGMRGIFPLSDELIRAYVDAGWVFRSRITIDKDPELVAIRTWDADLTYGSLKRSGLHVAPVAPDYMLVFAKPGDPEVETDPVGRGDIDFNTWCRWARAIWYDVREVDVLDTSKGTDDERHIAPTQLEVARRAITLWSNPGEVIFSPFAGIASEGTVAVRLGRRFLGIELKQDYFNAACRNLRSADAYSGGTLL